MFLCYLLYCHFMQLHANKSQFTDTTGLDSAMLLQHHACYGTMFATALCCYSAMPLQCYARYSATLLQCYAATVHSAQKLCIIVYSLYALKVNHKNIQPRNHEITKHLVLTTSTLLMKHLSHAIQSP